MRDQPVGRCPPAATSVPPPPGVVAWRATIEANLGKLLPARRFEIFGRELMRIDFHAAANRKHPELIFDVSGIGQWRAMLGCFEPGDRAYRLVEKINRTIARCRDAVGGVLCADGSVILG